MKSRAFISRSAPILTLVVVSLGSMGCNLFGGFDKPSEPEDKYAAALAKADAGECDEAKNILVTIAKPDDNAKIALGWAYLCIAGATASKIASSIYKYSSGNNDLTVIGSLARTMIPVNATGLTAINNAIAAFETVTDQKTRNLQLGIARFVNSAAILANQATNAAGTSELTRSDVGPSACSTTDCTTNGATCTGTDEMSSTNVDSFFSNISAAATALSVAGADSLKGLATALNSGIGATQAHGRCFIYNNVISAQSQ